MKFLMMFAQLIPLIISIVRQIEVVMPGPKQGAAKLDLILNTVGVAAAGSQEVVEALEGRDLNAKITSVVNATVATLNAAGVFTKTP